MLWWFLSIYWMATKLVLLLLCAGGVGVFVGFLIGLKWVALMEDVDKRKVPTEMYNKGNRPEVLYKPPAIPDAFKPKRRDRKPPSLRLVRSIQGAVEKGEIKVR